MARRLPADPLAAVGALTDTIVPSTSAHELEQVIEKVHPTHRQLIMEGIAHGTNHYQRLFAAAAAAILVKEEMEPNSAVTLYPATLAPGATAAVNTVYQLVPFKGAAAQQTFQFVRGMRFFGLLTGTADATAGWNIVAGSLMFGTDAISGIQYGDSSFALFQPDVVAGRQVTGEYQRHEVIEIVPFFASATLRSLTPAAMIEGLTVQYWDNRCKEDASGWGFWNFEGRGGFAELVQDLQDRASAGGLMSRITNRFGRNRFAR
jgi:hypothetical protein